MKLEPNKIYENITESCGKLVLKGKLIGRLNQDYGVTDVLIFENKTDRKDSYKFFGARWMLGGEAMNPRVYLRSTHYGNSADELKVIREITKRDVELF